MADMDNSLDRAGTNPEAAIPSVDPCHVLPFCDGVSVPDGDAG